MLVRVFEALNEHILYKMQKQSCNILICTFTLIIAKMTTSNSKRSNHFGYFQAGDMSPGLSRKSKWFKVRNVFLQGSRSAPSSPVRSASFTYEIGKRFEIINQFLIILRYTTPQCNDPNINITSIVVYTCFLRPNFIKRSSSAMQFPQIIN